MFQSSIPERLSMPQAPVEVDLAKHVYEEFVVLEYICKNKHTTPIHWLKNVSFSSFHYTLH